MGTISRKLRISHSKNIMTPKPALTLKWPIRNLCRKTFLHDNYNVIEKSVFWTPVLIKNVEKRQIESMLSWFTKKHTPMLETSGLLFLVGLKYL